MHAVHYHRLDITQTSSKSGNTTIQMWLMNSIYHILMYNHPELLRNCRTMEVTCAQHYVCRQKNNLQP
jgi:hypothetical protein